MKKGSERKLGTLFIRPTTPSPLVFAGTIPPPPICAAGSDCPAIEPAAVIAGISVVIVSVIVIVEIRRTNDNPTAAMMMVPTVMTSSTIPSFNRTSACKSPIATRYAAGVEMSSSIEVLSAER
jgi:hypothetical protein